MTLPNTIHATVGQLSGCTACALPFSMTLTWNAVTSKWEGTAQFGSCAHNVTLKFYKTAATACTDCKIDVVWPDTCAANIIGGTAFSCQCSPFQWVFEGFDGLVGCGCEGLSTQLKITITP